MAPAGAARANIRAATKVASDSFLFITTNLLVLSLLVVAEAP
jgi:hypothetical protein